MTKWSEPDDARTRGGKYPNYDIHKTPSGHVLNMDDSDGAESVTLQHRSGSMVQMHPNGDIVIRSHGTQYSIVFGDNKMMITGNMDVTVNGGGSLRVEGDYDMTVAGDLNTVVSGNMNTLVGGNQNVSIKGNQDTAIKGSQTTKIEGNTEHTSEGKSYFGAHGGMAVESTGGDLRVASNDNMAFRIGGQLSSESDSSTTIKGSVIDLNP